MDAEIALAGNAVRQALGGVPETGRKVTSHFPSPHAESATASVPIVGAVLGEPRVGAEQGEIELTDEFDSDTKLSLVKDAENGEVLHGE